MSLMQPLMKFFNLHTLGAPVKLHYTPVSGRSERAVSGVTVPCKLSKLPEQGLWGNVEGLGCRKEKCNISGFHLLCFIFCRHSKFSNSTLVLLNYLSSHSCSETDWQTCGCQSTTKHSCTLHCHRHWRWGGYVSYTRADRKTDFEWGSNRHPPGYWMSCSTSQATIINNIMRQYDTNFSMKI